ncbi:MAG: lysophospholipid acyltransferase family protein [Parvularculaceae bacterium]|nr:lysophospholipid acyltransferase family protein [Parvularculaceae bacterium]
MASLSKRILTSAPAQRAASAGVALYIRVVEATSRTLFVGREHADALLAGDKGFILAFWHARLLMGPIIRRETDRRVAMLMSGHRDGALIAAAVKGFGIDMIRGSSHDPKKPEKNKSGASAVAAMIGALNEGAIVGMTPDGPRGPAEIAKIGALRLAAMTGAPILPAGYAASRAKRLATWDRFVLTLPFSRMAFAARAPIHIEKGATEAALEAARARLETEINAAVADAERALEER